MSDSEEPIDYTIDDERAGEKPIQFRDGRGHLLAIVHRDGSIEYGSHYKPTEAAALFWEEMGRRRLHVEERLLILNHIEGIITRLGIADLQNQTAQQRLGEQPTPENGRAAGRAQNLLERTMSQAIELGRGLARRPGVLPTEVPARIPRQVAENPDSSYQGRAGLEPTDEG